MRSVRVIPTLLIYNRGLVKSVRFKNHTYVGDPINAVKIFNEKEVDELIILDISARDERRPPDTKHLREIANEAFMPMGYGGGIRTLNEIKDIISIGFEKVILNTAAFSSPDLVSDAAKLLGSQSVVVSIDVKNTLWRGSRVFVENGRKNTGIPPVSYARAMQDAGAGELLINSIDRDGTFTGYDTELIQVISASVKIPVVALGGASTFSDFVSGIISGASAVSAGSMFVFQGPHKAVLISYPEQSELEEKLYTKLSE